MPPAAERIDVAETHVLAPGFVDLQVNGGGGVLFNDAPDPATLRRIAAAHAEAGTTAILPTLISGTRAAIARRPRRDVRAALADGVPGIAGLHLEGPFIAAVAPRHPSGGAIATPDRRPIWPCCARPSRRPLLITLAPEAVPPEHIRRLVACRRLCSPAIPMPAYDTVDRRPGRRHSGFTHLYNAMSGFLPRAPARPARRSTAPAASPASSSMATTCTMPRVRIAFAAKGPDALFLVSDAMPTAASERPGFVLNGEHIQLHDGKLVNDAGTLAGAHLTMAEAVRRAVVHVGLPLTAALRMATQTPARAVGLADRGRIAPGCRADLVVLDSDLRVAAVWQQGLRLR